MPEPLYRVIYADHHGEFFGMPLTWGAICAHLRARTPPGVRAVRVERDT